VNNNKTFILEITNWSIGMHFVIEGNTAHRVVKE